MKKTSKTVARGKPMRRVLLTLEVETNMTVRELEQTPRMQTDIEGRYLRLLQVQANVIRGTREPARRARA